MPEEDYPFEMEIYPVDMALYSRSSWGELVATGAYDYVGPDVEPFFPLSKQLLPHANCHLVECRGIALLDEAIARVHALGLSPAEINVLSAFGAQHPLVQRHYAVAALGSIVQPKASKLAPYLFSTSQFGRFVGIVNCTGAGGAAGPMFAGGCSDRWRFLAVSG